MLRKGAQAVLQAERAGTGCAMYSAQAEATPESTPLQSRSPLRSVPLAGPQQTCAAAQTAFTRQFGAPAGSHDHPTTPLSPIMPGESCMLAVLLHVQAFRT